MDKKKDIMNIPKQPISQRILKYTLTTAIVFASLWSAAGLEITIERILDAPRQIGILVGAMFPLDTSQEAIDRICLLYTSPSPRDWTISRMPSYA